MPDDPEYYYRPGVNIPLKPMNMEMRDCKSRYAQKKKYKVSPPELFPLRNSQGAFKQSTGS